MSIQQQTVEITVAIDQQAVAAEEVALNVDNMRGLPDQSLLSSQDLSIKALQGFEDMTRALLAISANLRFKPELVSELFAH